MIQPDGPSRWPDPTARKIGSSATRSARQCHPSLTAVKAIRSARVALKPIWRAVGSGQRDEWAVRTFHVFPLRRMTTLKSLNIMARLSNS